MLEKLKNVALQVVTLAKNNLNETVVVLAAAAGSGFLFDSRGAVLLGALAGVGYVLVANNLKDKK